MIAAYLFFDMRCSGVSLLQTFLLAILILDLAATMASTRKTSFSLGTHSDRLIVSLPLGVLYGHEQGGEKMDQRVEDFLHSLSSVERNLGEVVDWYDEKGDSIMPLPRKFIHEHNLLHKGIGCLLLSKTGEAFMHMRSRRKKTWPGLYDTLIGGINIAGQSSTQTLVRELREEVGLDIAQGPAPTTHFLGQCRIATSQNQCIVDTYCVKLVDSRELRFADGEVEWGKWVPVAELKSMINEEETSFVPSGLQVWRYIESLGLL